MDRDMVNNILYVQKKHCNLLELKAKAGSSQNPIEILACVKSQSTLRDDKHLSSRSLSENLCDLNFSAGDASTLSTEVSPESEDFLWNRQEHLRGEEVCPPRSWTIHIYNKQCHAGDAVWFRIWSNASDTYIELKDKEILYFTQAVVERKSTFCFYVKTTEKGGFESVSVFNRKVIDRAMRLVLERAQHEKRIVIPSMEELKWAKRLEKKLEKKGKRGFWGFLRSTTNGGLAGNR